jgi:HD-like signal output (HDOD) protein
MICPSVFAAEVGGAHVFCRLFRVARQSAMRRTAVAGVAQDAPGAADKWKSRLLKTKAPMSIARSLPQKAAAAEADPSGFIRKLSLELAVGDIRLPSFPDIAVRVQRVLEDTRAPRTQVAQVIGADAALAARILRLANSAFFSPSTHQITDLQQALTRLGNQLVRCTAVSFSLQQMTLGGAEAERRATLQKLWRQGTLVASIAYVIARETQVAKPDEALMTGLMHNIGRLYIAVSETRHAVESIDCEAWANMVQEWHPRIAGAILKHWKFPPPIIAAVSAQNDLRRESRGDGLTDVLLAAIALLPCVFNRDMLEETVLDVPTLQRLGLGAAECRRLLAATADQIKVLQAALTQ